MSALHQFDYILAIVFVHPLLMLELKSKEQVVYLSSIFIQVAITYFSSFFSSKKLALHRYSRF